MADTQLPNTPDFQAIVAKIKEVLATHAKKPVAGIRLEDDLLVDLGLDSLAIAELLTVLEDHIQREVRVDDLLEVSTVGDLAVLLAAYQGTRSSSTGGPSAM